MRLGLEPPRDPAAYRFSHLVRARFAETDAMGVVHHASYLPWLEEARVAFLAAAGHPYREVRAAGIDIAVIEVHAQYLAPARFDDEIRIFVLVGAVTKATLQIAYLLRRADTDIAAAVTVHACLGRESGRPVRVPEWVIGLADPPDSA
jgi:acyl-CoA thioester hydrolase